MGQPIRFYLDERLGRAVALALSQQGFDVLSVPEASMLVASDEDQLAMALSDDRLIVTRDSDFLRLHASGKEHAGIVYASHEHSQSEIIQGLTLIAKVLSADEMRGHVEFI